MNNLLRKTLALSALALTAFGLPASGAKAAEGGMALPEVHYHFQGIFGSWDKAQLQRGFQVYNEVCSSCHSMHLLSFRNLEQIGFSEDEVKAIAQQYTVFTKPDANGEVEEVTAKPSDHIRGKGVYENAPDLSLMAKARAGGPQYIHAVLTGYQDAPADVELAPGTSYNLYFPGHQIAMPQPLYGDDVTYADGTETSLNQISTDVSAFLMWAAEPYLEERKRTGVKVLLFLIVLTGMLYAVKRKVWKDLH
jgi:ubiquinol-cytochrome c reductase cytochrome c1 subunit